MVSRGRGLLTRRLKTIVAFMANHTVRAPPCPTMCSCRRAPTCCGSPTGTGRQQDGRFARCQMCEIATASRCLIRYRQSRRLRHQRYRRGRRHLHDPRPHRRLLLCRLHRDCRRRRRSLNRQAEVGDSLGRRPSPSMASHAQQIRWCRSATHAPRALLGRVGCCNRHLLPVLRDWAVTSRPQLVALNHVRKAI